MNDNIKINRERGYRLDSPGSIYGSMEYSFELEIKNRVRQKMVNL